MSPEAVDAGVAASDGSSSSGVILLPKFRSLVLTAAGPAANIATTMPPAAIAMGAVNKLVNALACNPPRGIMLQVIP